MNCYPVPPHCRLMRWPGLHGKYPLGGIEVSLVESRFSEVPFGRLGVNHGVPLREAGRPIDQSLQRPRHEFAICCVGEDMQSLGEPFRRQLLDLSKLRSELEFPLEYDLCGENGVRNGMFGFCGVRQG